MSDPYRYFRVEASELLEQLQVGLLDLERGADGKTVLPGLLRHAHTLKGAARVVKQPEIADIAHALEDALVPVRDGVRPLAEDVVQGCLQQLDQLRLRVAALSKPAAPEQATRESLRPAALEPQAEFVRLVRADAEDLTAMTDGLLELSGQLGTVRRGLEGLSRTRQLADLLHDKLGARGSQRSSSDARFAPLAEELHANLTKLERELGAGLEQASRELAALRDGAERLRLVRAGVMWNSLERTARDAAQSLGKRVRVETSGADVRLDFELVGQVQRALVQAVRNAVAHGLESPEQRVAQGKPAEGRVKVGVVRCGRELHFECTDDGRGIDLAEVRRKLVLRDGESATSHDAKALIAQLLRGGISTSRAVSAIAGRGIGLDLVRETAEQLGGSLTINSSPGRGVALELRVPATVAALEALMVEVNGQALAIPLEVVRSTALSRDSELTRTAEGEALVLGGTLIPFAPLASLLRAGNGALTSRRAWASVVLEAAAGRVAVGVDRLLGTENVVTRPLPEWAPSDPTVTGASLDADGNPRLLLSADALLQAVRALGVRGKPQARRPDPILVIDDSLTTRMLEQSILESAGYEVDTATSAEEGLEKARKRRYSLFLVDVEMPGMDGFTFIETICADRELGNIPAILVTSRNSADDFARSAAVGAKAHIIKSEFDQIDLLAKIGRLVS